MKDAWIIALLQTVSLLLLIAEVLLPSGGLLMVATLGTLGYSLWLAFQVDLTTGFALTLADLIVFPLVGILALKRMGNSPAALQTRLESTPPTVDDLHRIGTAVTDLRPVGQARLGGKLCDVVSDAGFLAAGTAIEVIRTDGNRLLVRPIQP